MRWQKRAPAGFSTIEIMIAVAIVLVALSSVITVSFGNQALIGQSAAYDDALSQAHIQMAQEISSARQDFRLLNTVATSSDGLIETSATIHDWPNDPFTTKDVEVDSVWTENGYERSVSLEELVSNLDDPTSLDTCDSALSGDWRKPAISTHTFIAGDLLPFSVPAGHSFSAQNAVASLDAYHRVLYAANVSTSNKANDSFFAFDIASPPHVRYLGSIDTNTASIDGAAAVVVAGGYAYLANPHAADFKSCKAGSASCAQLQIVNVKNPSAIPSPINYELPTSTAPAVTGSSGQAVGKSIAYDHGYLFLGLTKTGSGPEFNIIDVSSSTNLRWIGGFVVGAGVSAISVRKGYAYLATDQKSDELLVLDVSKPSSPTLVGAYDVTSPSDWGSGESIYQRGSSTYLGLTYATGSPEIYALNSHNPAALSLVGTYTASSSVVGEIMRDSLLFALTSTSRQLQILDASSASSILPYTAPLSIPTPGTTLDCEGNYLYAGSNGAISIIGPGS